MEYTCCRSPELRVLKRTLSLVSIFLKQMSISNIGGGTKFSIEFINNDSLLNFSLILSWML